MPAPLPGDTAANNLGNPNAGRFVIFDLLSGPKGSPFDVRKITSYVGGTPQYANDAANQQPSTGGLSSGIGFGTGGFIGQGFAAAGLTNIINAASALDAPVQIKKRGFTDDYTPGVTKPDGTASADSRLMYIGGGKTVTSGAPNYANVPGQAGAVPYTAGFGIGGAGQGGSRDAGAGPAFTGFLTKMVTATGAVANGAAIEATWINRSGVGMVAFDSTFGSSNAASAAPV